MSEVLKKYFQTVSSILTFLLAMCHYPEVQKKAHAELMAVMGADRLPEFSDRVNLPYINAIVLEVLRWQPVTNFGKYLVVSIARYNSYIQHQDSLTPPQPTMNMTDTSFQKDQ